MSLISPDAYYLLDGFSLCHVKTDDADGLPGEEERSCIPLVGFNGCPVAATINALDQARDLDKPFEGTDLMGIVGTNPLLAEDPTDSGDGSITFRCQRADLAQSIPANSLVEPSAEVPVDQTAGYLTFRQLILP